MRVLVVLLTLILFVSIARVTSFDVCVRVKDVHQKFLWLADLPKDVFVRSLGIKYSLRCGPLFRIPYHLDAEIQGLNKCTKTHYPFHSQPPDNWGIPYFLFKNVIDANDYRFHDTLKSIYLRQLVLTVELKDWIQQSEPEIGKICHQESNTDMTKYVLYLIGRTFSFVGNGFLDKHDSDGDFDDIDALVVPRKRASGNADIELVLQKPFNDEKSFEAYKKLVVPKPSNAESRMRNFFNGLLKDMQTIYLGSALKLVYDRSVKQPQRKVRADKLSTLGNQLQQQWKLTKYWRLKAPDQRHMLFKQYV